METCEFCGHTRDQHGEGRCNVVYDGDAFCGCTGFVGSYPRTREDHGCINHVEDAHRLFRQIQQGVNLDRDIRWQLKARLFLCHYGTPRCTWGEE